MGSQDSREQDSKWYFGLGKETALLCSDYLASAIVVACVPVTYSTLCYWSFVGCCLRLNGR